MSRPSISRRPPLHRGPPPQACGSRRSTTKAVRRSATAVMPAALPAAALAAVHCLGPALSSGRLQEEGDEGRAALRDGGDARSHPLQVLHLRRAQVAACGAMVQMKPVSATQDRAAPGWVVLIMLFSVSCPAVSLKCANVHRPLKLPA